MIEKLGITPGPWEVTGVRNHIIAEKNGERIICEMWNEQEPQTEANARLIAAAPELLEAMIELHDELENDNWNVEWVKGIIEKATGKTWEGIKRLQEE